MSVASAHMCVCNTTREPACMTHKYLTVRPPLDQDAAPQSSEWSLKRTTSTRPPTDNPYGMKDLDKQCLLFNYGSYYSEINMIKALLYGRQWKYIAFNSKEGSHVDKRTPNKYAIRASRGWRAPLENKSLWKLKKMNCNQMLDALDGDECWVCEERQHRTIQRDMEAIMN